MSRPKVKPEKKRVSKSVTMRPDVLAALEKMGDGNLSAGIEEMFYTLQSVIPKPEKLQESALLEGHLEDLLG